MLSSFHLSIEEVLSMTPYQIACIMRGQNILNLKQEHGVTNNRPLPGGTYKTLKETKDGPAK